MRNTPLKGFIKKSPLTDRRTERGREKPPKGSGEYFEGKEIEHTHGPARGNWRKADHTKSKKVDERTGFGV